jgi:hypothetical protein
VIHDDRRGRDEDKADHMKDDGPPAAEGPFNGEEERGAGTVDAARPRRRPVDIGEETPPTSERVDLGVADDEVLIVVRESVPEARESGRDGEEDDPGDREPLAALQTSTP